MPPKNMERIPPAPVLRTVETPPSSAPPNPPRPVTSQVRRLIWLEPRVRRWWLLGVLIFLMFACYAGDRLYARLEDSRLIRHGVVLHAKIVAAENKVINHPVGPDDVVQLQFTWPDGSQDTVTGQLALTGVVGGEVRVHVDPADHTHWTDRHAPISLIDTLLIGILVLPLIPAVVAVAWVQARALMVTWQNGSAVPAAIFDRKQSPIAPMSYALRCSLSNNRKKELVTVFVPRAKSGLDKGDLIWVIAPTKKGRPLAAMWMAGKSA